MIVVLAEVESSVEAIENVREALLEMQTASRAEEACRDYCFCQEIGDPTRLRIVEIWDSMDGLRFHFGTPHMATFRKVLAGFPQSSMNLKVHELGSELELPS